MRTKTIKAVSATAGLAACIIAGAVTYAGSRYENPQADTTNTELAVIAGGLASVVGHDEVKRILRGKERDRAEGD